MKFVSYKDRKELSRDMKSIYTAPTEEVALSALKSLKEKWSGKYPHVIKSWEDHWVELSAIFKYPEPIRRLIYTTNPIESFNSALRKVTKNRGAFPTEDSLFKLLYLAIGDITKRWINRIRDWSLIYPQLYIFFQERIERLRGI